MNYHWQFPPQSRARVEAERVRARRDLVQARTEEPPSDWRNGASGWDQCAFYQYIVRVFSVFAHEACELGRQGIWTVDWVRSAAMHFLRTFSIDAYWEQGYDRFGRQFPAITGNMTGELLLEVERSFHVFDEWVKFEDELLVVAEIVSNPQGTDASGEQGATDSAPPNMETDGGSADHDRGKIRAAWLDQMLARHKEWTSDTDIESNGGPAYNTIQRYRSGTGSTRDNYVRRRLAKAFKCEITEVPE